MRRVYPLRWLLLAPVMLVFLLAVVGVGVMGWRVTRGSSLALQAQLVDEIGSAIEQHMQTLLHSVSDAVSLNRVAFRHGQFKADSGEALQQHLVNQLRHAPHLTFITLGLPDGSMLSASRRPDDGSLRLVMASSGDALTRYTVSASADLPDQVEARGAPYDARAQVWFKRASSSMQAGWYPVVAYLSYPSLGLGMSAPMEDERGRRFLGVASADLALVQVSRFLADRFAGRPGLAFVTEADGKLLASSLLQAPVSDNPEERLRARQLDKAADPRLRAVAALAAQLAESKDRRVQTSITVEGQTYATELRRIEGPAGLRLIQGVMVDEATFQGSLRDRTRLALAWLLAIALIGSLVMLVILRRLLAQLGGLSRAAERIAAGERQARVPETGHVRELRFLAGSFNHMSDQVERALQGLESEVAARTEALERANQELQRLVSLDGLTQIANRRHFDERLGMAWRRCLRTQQPLALLLIDVDDFKAYNDFYGHPAGDQVLRDLARLLVAQQRRPDDLAARYGGEEFLLLLPDCDVDAASAEAQTLHRALRELHLPHARSRTGAFVSASIGVAVCVPTPAHEPIELLAAADAALYRAKAGGRNRTELAHEIHDTK